MSLRQGAKMTGSNDESAKDIISMYRNRKKSLYHLSLDAYFYQHFCSNVLKDGCDDDEIECTSNRILMPSGQNFKPVYPVTYEYAKGIVIQHMPWSKENPPTKLLQNKQKTIRKFKTMITNKQLPSSVCGQYICAVKYHTQKRLEIIATQGTEQPYNLDDMSDEERERCIAHQHASHFSEQKYLSNEIDGMMVDIGTDIDWTVKTFTESRSTKIDGEKWVQYAQDTFDRSKRNQNNLSAAVDIPKQKDNTPYSVTGSPEQEQIVYTAVDTVIKFLTNDPTYKPMRATIMGPGGTGKSHIINTIIGMVRQLTNCNNTVQVAAPSGAAAFNVQGSTLHNLLSLGVTHPENKLSAAKKERLMEQLERLLVLIIDERSMISSKVLAAAERNTRECIFNGHNIGELWGGLPVVLLFGDDYQLMPVKKDGAIHGFAKRQAGRTNIQHRSNMKDKAQYFSYRGDWLFTEIMTQNVYFLTKNYRVKCERFKDILQRVRVGSATTGDAHQIMKLHHTFYKNDKEFKNVIENHDKTMWLYSKNAQVSDKNRNKLVETSTKKKVPVARLNCWYDTNKLQNSSDRIPIRSHFEHNAFVHKNDFCIGSRVALRGWNILPSAGLYSGSIGNVVEIVYNSNPVGPNDKEHYHLPDFVVVDFPHLNLPSNVRPWDSNHPTVSATMYCRFCWSTSYSDSN